MAKLDMTQIGEIIILAERGWKSGRIAQKTGINQSTVNYQMLKAGFDPFSGNVPKQTNRGQAFSPEEDAQLLHLAQSGMKLRDIMATMRRAQTSIRLRLMLLEVRAEKKLEAA